MPDLQLYINIKPKKLPRVWFCHYVVYKYSHSKSTYVVGFGSDTKANDFQNEILAKKDVIRCEIYGHFPIELLETK